MVRPSATKVTSSSTQGCCSEEQPASVRTNETTKTTRPFTAESQPNLDPGRDVVEHHLAFGLVEHLVVQLGVDLEVHICCAYALDQVPAAVDGDQLVLLSVHHEQRRGQRTR